MIIVKIGGSEGTDFNAICADVAEAIAAGESFVIVHGGSKETNVLSEALGRPPRFVTSVSGQVSRYTDRATLEMFAMAVAGKINTLLVEALQRHGVNAVGLTGLDGRLLEAQRKETIKVIEDGKKKLLRGDYTGRIETVNVGLLRLLLDQGYTPVIAPLAIATTHEAVNVDGDRAAAMIAGAMGAERLIIFSNVPGLLRDVADPGSLIEEIPRDRLEEFAQFAAGRMKKKIMGTEEALRGGVREIRLADGRIEHPLRNALEGRCTVIR
jgi:acetylglutamate/LysW-gamma-L-alpha-aminoadipate kinase